MKSYIFYIFISIISGVYLLVNWYVISRGAKALEGQSWLPYVKITYWVLALSFIVGQFLERGEPTAIARFTTHVGSVWLAVFLYLLIFVLAVDILRLFDYWFHFIPKPIFGFISNGMLAFYSGIFIAFLVSGMGYLNARYPRVKQVDIPIEKPIPGKKNLKIALITDLHIGAIIGEKRVHEMVNKINEQKPDLVLFAGDVVDHNPLFVKAANIGPEFLRLHAPMGAYAVAGNHEFIGHAEISINYLKQFGLHYVRDTIMDIDGIIQLVGRDDRERKQFEGDERKALTEIMKTLKPNLPTILLDHQPVEYDAVEKYGVDLMLSGHTHKGQLWPFGYITSKVYENDYGLIRKEKTWFYTSTGYGTWGPPIRTGNRPELVIFNLHN